MSSSAADRQWWLEWLGVTPDRPARARWYDVDELADGMTCRRLDLEVPGATLQCALVEPAGSGPRPVVVIPFYDTGVVIGRPDPDGWQPSNPDLARYAYAQHLAERGMAALAVPWWFEVVTTDKVRNRTLDQRYAPAVATHRASSAGTGLGRAVADLMLAVDAVADLPSIDPERIGVFGHSLGGKLALHLAALDPRVRAGVAHEPGLGLANSNWDAPWYLDGRTPDDRDHDQLLELIAPRPFLLIGGGSADGEHTRPLVRTPNVDFVLHDAGHTPTWAVLQQSYGWLDARLVDPDAVRSLDSLRP